MKINPDDKIKIELINESHAEELFTLTDNNRNFLKQWLPWLDGTQTVNDTLNFIKKSIMRNEENDGFENIIKYDERIAGIAGLHYISHNNRKTEMGYWLAKEFNGKGIMTYACSKIIEYCFEKINLNRIEIRCAVNNIRSRGIPERLNFRNEGILRQEIFLNGKFVDHVLYALLREEWKSDANKKSD